MLCGLRSEEPDCCECCVACGLKNLTAVNVVWPAVWRTWLLWMLCGLRTEELSSCGLFPKSAMTAIKPPPDLTFQGQHSGPRGGNALCSIARQQNQTKRALLYRSVASSVAWVWRLKECPVHSLFSKTADKAVNNLWSSDRNVWHTLYTKVNVIHERAVISYIKT